MFLYAANILRKTIPSNTLPWFPVFLDFMLADSNHLFYRYSPKKVTHAGRMFKIGSKIINNINKWCPTDFRVVTSIPSPEYKCTEVSDLGIYACIYVPEGGKLCITGDRREPADRAPDYKTVLEEGELSVQNALWVCSPSSRTPMDWPYSSPQVPFATLAPPAVMQSLPPSGTLAK